MLQYNDIKILKSGFGIVNYKTYKKYIVTNFIQISLSVNGCENTHKLLQMTHVSIPIVLTAKLNHENCNNSIEAVEDNVKL